MFPDGVTLDTIVKRGRKPSVKKIMPTGDQKKIISASKGKIQKRISEENYYCENSN